MRKILAILFSIIFLQSQAFGQLGFVAFVPYQNVTLSGGGSANINVGGKLTNVGAVIANADVVYDEKTGRVSGLENDKGNMTVSAKEFEYEDLKDRNVSESKGWGVNTSLGGKLTDRGALNLAPSGSTTVSKTDKGKVTEQTTKATLGAGTITVNGVTLSNEGAEGSALAGLNHDITKSQEITKDEITGALDASVTIDNRVLLGFLKNEAKDKEGNVIYEKDENGEVIRDNDGNPIAKTTTGWQSIGNDFTNFGKNIETITGVWGGALGSLKDKIGGSAKKAAEAAAKREEFKKKMNEEIEKMRNNKAEAEKAKAEYIKNLIENKDYAGLMSAMADDIRTDKELRKSIKERMDNNEAYYDEINQYYDARTNSRTGIEYVKNEIARKIAANKPNSEIQTYCNLDVESRLASKYDIIIPANGREGKTANQIFDYMRDEGSNDWEMINRTSGGHLDHVEAQKKAADGYIVVAVYKNNTGNPGHVVFVTDKPLYDDKVWIDGLNTLDKRAQAIQEDMFSTQFASRNVVAGTQFFYYKTKPNQIENTRGD